jgi:thiol:disulfide interchange protein DsbD
MATAWFGSGVQAALQNPFVMFAFAGLMLVLAGSLLGFYEFHLPQFWHAHVDKLIGKQKGGSLLGAFLLGALSSLVASPCITAPMAGVLTFIAQSGEVKLGGLILFTMAWGMGVPLLLFALGASRVVPRAGAWMVLVQKVFGVLMVVLALWFVWPAVSSLLVTHHSESKNISNLTFKVVRTQAELKNILDKAKAESKPVVLNFYADWCVSCKELEMLTFSDPRVSSKLENYERVEVDVTRSDNDQKELLKQFGLFGPPALIFIGADGAEKKSARAVGYLPADKLLLKM